MVGVLNLAALFVLILTGEVVPKLVAAQHPMVWSNWAALPLMVVHRVLTPIRGVVRGAIIVPLSRLLAPRQRPVELSPAELERLLELSQHQGVIDDQEEQLLQQVLSLSQLKVRDLMRPRIDMIAFELTQNPQKLIAMVAETRFSRLPVYRRDIDHIVGVVHRRQVLLTKPRTTDQVQALVRPARFVPDLQRADRLLVELRKARSTMVVVVDEYGGTAGLVTLEDVVEKMVGKIANRHESEPAPQVQSVGADQWRVSARLGILDWVSAFGTVVPIAGVSTIGGLIMARLGRLPNVGDRTNVGNLSIEVEKMDGRRMVTLLLQLTDGHSDDQAQAEK
jgi:CBS domain containing-hemolysin-like protein